MTVWGIADLHLSFARDDPRERFAGRWRDHAATIERNWMEVVGRDDLVLIPGDVSMARNHREVQPDLRWLDRLPGLKVLAPGNHDRWWNNTASIRPLMRRSLRAVGGDAVCLGSAVVCGTLGAEVPSDETPSASQSAAAREAGRLDEALAAAASIRGAGQSLYVLWHYPPFDEQGRPGPWVGAMERAGVTACLYGHLHARSQWGRAAQGTINGILYRCVAADSLGFRPLRIDPPRPSGGPGERTT